MNLYDHPWLNLCLTFLFVLASSIPLMADDPFQEMQIEFSCGIYKQEIFKCRLLPPENMEPGKKYPLVLFLHGAGERGDDNAKQLKYLPAIMATPEKRKQFPCFLLAPQCRGEQKWVNAPWNKLEPEPLAEESSCQMQAAIKMLDQTIADNPIDGKRVYVTGLSMGGYGSWDLVSRHPDRFAAALIACGGGDPALAKKLVDVPIWNFHGDSDPVVPVERSRIMVEAIKEAGGGKIKYNELPGVGHASWNTAYDDETGAIQWMFEQTKQE